MKADAFRASGEALRPFEVDRTPRLDEMRQGRQGHHVNSVHQPGIAYQYSQGSLSPNRRLEPRNEQAHARHSVLQGKKPSAVMHERPKASNSSQLKLKLDMGRLKKQERANTNNTRDDIYSDGHKEGSYTFYPNSDQLNQDPESRAREPHAAFDTRTFDHRARQAELSHGRVSHGDDHRQEDLGATSKTVTVIGAQFIPGGNSRRRGTAAGGSEIRHGQTQQH